MYAVIKTGGKQYYVKEGDIFDIEKLPSESGSTVEFKEVLQVGTAGDITIGTPTVANACVNAEILTHGKGKKIRIVKFKRRKHYDKVQGHRQLFTRVKITKISTN